MKHTTSLLKLYVLHHDENKLFISFFVLFLNIFLFNQCHYFCKSSMQAFFNNRDRRNISQVWVNTEHMYENDLC